MAQRRVGLARGRDLLQHHFGIEKLRHAVEIGRKLLRRIRDAAAARMACVFEHRQRQLHFRVRRLLARQRRAFGYERQLERLGVEAPIVGLFDFGDGGSGLGRQRVAADPQRLVLARFIVGLERSRIFTIRIGGLGGKGVELLAHERAEQLGLRRRLDCGGRSRGLGRRRRGGSSCVGAGRRRGDGGRAGCGGVCGGRSRRGSGRIGSLRRGRRLIGRSGLGHRRRADHQGRRQQGARNSRKPISHLRHSPRTRGRKLAEAAWDEKASPRRKFPEQPEWPRTVVDL